LRPQVQAAEIREIHVEAYRGSVAMMGSDPTRWAPTTRETADHSMPFVIATALLDGAITDDSYAAAKFTDPAVVGLMRKVKVSENAQMSEQYPESAPGRVTITTISGAVLTREMRYPIGHAKNPMSDAAVEAKFRELLRGRCEVSRSEQLLQTLWAFERVTDIRSEVLEWLAADLQRNSK
jgi:2-methylcitrate dehydratase